MRFYFRVVEEFSNINVDDILQLRKKKTILFFCVHVCSNRACNGNVLSTVRPSRPYSVTVLTVWPSNDRVSDEW